MFVVERRDRGTLLPIIQNEVLPGSVIVSDEWGAYKTLDQHGFQHRTVNHHENFVNPVNGANTQIIECVWSGLKLKIMRKMHGTTPEMLPRHLKEFWWRSINAGEDQFLSLLRNIRQVHM